MTLPFKNYILNTFNFSPRDSSQRTFQDASAYLMLKNKRTKPKSSPGYFSGAPSLLSPLHKLLKELFTATISSSLLLTLSSTYPKLASISTDSLH